MSSNIRFTLFRTSSYSNNHSNNSEVSPFEDEFLLDRTDPVYVRSLIRSDDKSSLKRPSLPDSGHMEMINNAEKASFQQDSIYCLQLHSRIIMGFTVMDVDKVSDKKNTAYLIKKVKETFFQSTDLDELFPHVPVDQVIKSYKKLTPLSDDSSNNNNTEAIGSPQKEEEGDTTNSYGNSSSSSNDFVEITRTATRVIQSRIIPIYILPFLLYCMDTYHCSRMVEICSPISKKLIELDGRRDIVIHHAMQLDSNLQKLSQVLISSLRSIEFFYRGHEKRIKGIEDKLHKVGSLLHRSAPAPAPPSPPKSSDNSNINSKEKEAKTEVEILCLKRRMTLLERRCDELSSKLRRIAGEEDEDEESCDES